MEHSKKRSINASKDLIVNAGVAVQNLDSWEEFIPLMTDDHHHCSGIVYRGQCDASWKLESKLDRLEKRFPTSPNYFTGSPEFFNCPPADRERHLEAFKECVRGKRGPNPSELSDNEWWALAQHHRLSTPLLDWAVSPFVALFFAFEEPGFVDIQEKSFAEPSHRAVYAASYLTADKGAGAAPPPFIFSPRREITFRLSSQTGVLMRMPHHSDLESIVRANFPNDCTTKTSGARAILTKIVMPNKGRKECLKLLNQMNVNRLTLFADLDAAAEYVDSLWELDFPTALGVFPDGRDAHSS